MTCEIHSVPEWLLWSLRGFCLLLALGILIYPELPQEWFLAVDPATGGPFIITRSHITQAQMHFLWALEGFRRIALPVRVVGFVALCGLMFVPSLRSRSRPAAGTPLPGARRRSLRWLVVIGGLAAVGVFYAFRVSAAKNAEFGDTTWLVQEVDGGWAEASDVLTYDAFIAVRQVLALFTRSPSPLQAITLTSCLAGGVFVAAMMVFARAAGQTWRERLALFCGTALAGYTAMFFGYVETTQVEVAAMALYFAFAASALRCPQRGERLKYLVLALAGLALALMAHAAGVLLLPSAALLLLADAALPDLGWRRALFSRTLLRNVGLAIVLVVLPYWQVVIAPYYLQGAFGNMTGGGDYSMFVPWRIDRSAAVPEFVYYSFLSVWHLADLSSALLVAAPLALPLGLCAAILAWRGGLRLPGSERWWLGTLAAGAGGCFLVPLIWNHDFGMWGDWNLVTCYLFPLNVFAWTAFFARIPHGQPAPALYRQTIVPLILIQAVLGVGMLLQLW